MHTEFVNKELLLQGEIKTQGYNFLQTLSEHFFQLEYHLCYVGFVATFLWNKLSCFST